MAKSSADRSVLKLAKFVKSLSGFQSLVRDRSAYNHMGATICDTILQAGLNYRTVVAPRVNQVIQRWPTAKTSSAFLFNIRRYDLLSVISWSDEEKPRRIISLTEFLVDEDLETEREVANWLTDTENVESLRKLRGFGPKTTDYFKMLVGISTVPVDRHVRSFLSKAGVVAKGYEATQAVFEETAELLNINKSSLDYAVWLHESSPAQRAA